MRAGELSLQKLVFLDCQENLLGVEGRSELLLGNRSFSERIVILEELKESDSIFLGLLLDFSHEDIELRVSLEVSLLAVVHWFGLSVNVLGSDVRGVGIFKEIHVNDLSVRVAVVSNQALALVVSEDKSESRQNLSELLGRDFEVLVLVPVLEEALGIESVLNEQVSESLHDISGLSNLLRSGSLVSIESLSAHVVKWNIYALLKALLREDLINLIAEVSPPHVFALFWRLEMITKQLKFSV